MCLAEYNHLIAQADIWINIDSMKRGIAPKNAVEMDPLQAYFEFSYKVYKNFYLICQANLFCNPKIILCNTIWGPSVDITAKSTTLLSMFTILLYKKSLNLLSVCGDYA